MALIKCEECGRSISDKATACPGCGAPVSAVPSPQDELVGPGPAGGGTPVVVAYDRESDTFTGTMALVAKVAMRAVHELGWKIDQVNEGAGLVTFQTGISWGSWSGVTCSLAIEEVAPSRFRVTGTGKQNISGLQMIALNIGGEAQKRARKAIEKMKQLVAE